MPAHLYQFIVLALTLLALLALFALLIEGSDELGARKPNAIEQ